MSMHRGGVLLLALLLVPGVASSPPVELLADSFGTDHGVALVRWDADHPGWFSLDAGTLSGVVTDESIQDRIDFGGPLVEHSTGSPETEMQSVPTGQSHLASLATRHTTLVILPLDGPFQATVVGSDTPAAVRLRAVEREVLEPQRRISDDPDDVTTAPPRYEAKDVVAAETIQAATLRVTGDFTLYVWDADMLQESAQGNRTYQTGFRSEEGTTHIHRTEHYVHATLTIRNGTLNVHTPTGASLYAERILLDGALGSATGPPGTPPPETQVLLATLPSGPAGISLQPLPPSDSQGPGLFPIKSDSWVPVVLTALTAVILLPNLLGKKTVPPQSESLVARLCRNRSMGFRRLAVAAEQRQRYLLASHWMGRAARWDRDGELRMQQAILLRLGGRPAKALRRHHQAEQMFRDQGTVHALNAYEAARAAARVGLKDESLQWLLRAVRAEPWLAKNAPFEPDLGRLRALPAFMDLTQATKPDGLLRP